ncbi:MAG: hypothetical protein KF819_21735 [Labilithrix sp.]|nr:hypothetical protein [Labilithrix sp.]
MKAVLLACAAATLAGCTPSFDGGPASASNAWSTDTEKAWTALATSLPGRWTSTTASNKTITVSYRLVSNGSALVETFTTASGKETLSVYHRSGRELMLTHYCAQGNQARLKATEARDDRVVFDFLDATNVSDEQGVMHRLSFALRGDGFDQTSVYAKAKGERDSTTLRFVRAAPE